MTARLADTIPELADLRDRQAKLRAEAVTLTEQRDRLYRLRRDGTNADEIDSAARDLLAGRKPVAVADPEHELAKVVQELAINAKSQAYIAKSIGLAELQRGHAAAAPLFDRAISHLPKLARLLVQLEAEQRAAYADIRTFEEVANPLTALEAQHPSQKPPYHDWELNPLRTWHAEIVGDGFNASKLQSWRAECAELGLKLD